MCMEILATVCSAAGHKNLKGQGPLNLKNKCPAAQWEIISNLLIPLYPSVSCR
jgi:hypothetical protein